MKATPFSRIGLYPGLEIHATAIENFLSDDFIHRTPLWIVISCMTVSTVLLFVLSNRLKNLRIFISAFFILIIAVILITYVLLTYNIWIQAIDIAGTSIAVFSALILSGYFSESKDIRLMRKQFERYVNETILEEILANPTAVDLKGRTMYATVMATDIADFTDYIRGIGSP